MNNSSSVKKKVLVVRFSSMGDIVLTTPVIRVLSEKFEVHFLTKNKFSLLLKSNPFITKMVTVEKDIHEVINELRDEDYDYVVDLHNNLRTYRLKRRIGKPSFTFSKINFKKWLSVRLKSVSVLPDEHIVDRMFRALAPLGLCYDGKGLDFFLPSAIELPKEFVEFRKLHTEFYSFSIGGTYYTKRCSERKVVDICGSINKAVVLLGGHEEYESGKRIADELSLPVLNLCGLVIYFNQRR
jgi:ADP-heptose:LPS heptosyltransferase